MDNELRELIDAVKELSKEIREMSTSTTAGLTALTQAVSDLTAAVTTETADVASAAAAISSLASQIGSSSEDPQVQALAAQMVAGQEKGKGAGNARTRNGQKKAGTASAGGSPRPVG